MRHFTYTATGNVANDSGPSGTYKLSYNQGNRLTSVINGGTQVASFAYDAFGQRLFKNRTIAPKSVTLYQYDITGHLIEESDATAGSATAQTDYVYLRDQPIAMLTPASGQIYTLHDDRLGTPQLATASSGKTVWRGDYHPYGSATIKSLITQPLRLPGQYQDAEMPYTHHGFREYLSGDGRFVETDPLGLQGGMNAYAYVENNPLRFTDKNGLECPRGSPDCIEPRIPN